MLGFSDKCITWLKSFLTDRKQRVKIGNCISQVIEVTSGVPQGSHCSPLLFNLFINDLPLYLVNCNFLLFADDLKIFQTINSFEDYKLLQNDLDNLNNWSIVNKLPLNIDKCIHISFFKVNKKFNTSYNIAGSILKSVSSIKDLGVIFDEQLTFVENINCISVKASKTLGFILRNCNKFSISSLKAIYASLVRSQLEYASIIWSPMYLTHIKTLENVQHKFVRYCSFKLNHPIIDHNYAEILETLELNPLVKRRLYADVIFIFKLLNGIVVCSDLLNLINFNVPNRILRNNYIFNLKHHATNYGQNSPIDRTLKIINNTNVDLFSSSLHKFIKTIKMAL